MDSYFNLTNEPSLIDWLQDGLIRFFDHLVVAYFLGHRVYRITAHQNWELRRCFNGNFSCVQNYQQPNS